MDGETRAKLTEMEADNAERDARIAELERKSVNQGSEMHRAVEEFEARHENVLFREALKTSKDLYAEYVKKCEEILKENTDKLRAQVGSLQGSNALLSNTITNEVEKTQSAARNVIAVLNAEVQNTLARALADFAQKAETIEQRYQRLANRRSWIDTLVAFAAMSMVAGIIFLLARH